MEFTYYYTQFNTFMLFLLNSMYIFNYIYLYEALFILYFSLIIWNLIINKAFRGKFIYFLLLLVIVGSWGIFYTCDGIILLLLIAELLIILLFLLMYLTINFEIKQETNYKVVFYIYIGVVFSIYLASQLIDINNNIIFITFINIYEQILDIISADFFIFFYFFFIMFPEITYLVAILLSFFSIFFIFFYFVLKYKQQSNNVKTLNYIFIRKQQLLHQANFTSQVVNFQK